VSYELDAGNFVDNVMAMVVLLEIAPDAEERVGNHKMNKHIFLSVDDR
jgi:hypothetical protein